VEARTLTVLFTDLVGSTSAWAGLDRAAADRRRTRHFALMRGDLAAHGGREVKNLGDGLMAVFESVGASLACAGAMQRSFHAARRGGEPMLGLRVGLATGDVTEEQGDAFGLPVIAACRLCALATADQVLLPAALRGLLGPDRHALRDAGVLELKGIGEPVPALELAWHEAGGDATRVVLADDATLVREGLARLLESEGIEVVAQVGDAVAALEAVAAERPHVVVLDIRMPPTHTTEGLEAAETILAAGDGIGVLLLSTHLDATYAHRLTAASTGSGVGYLAKERVVDVEEFAEAIRRVAGGGTAFDPELASALSEAPPP
jgi:class 3 adenylate cyclase/ActR/RegA family two-component response regulator